MTQHNLSANRCARRLLVGLGVLLSALCLGLIAQKEAHACDPGPDYGRDTPEVGMSGKRQFIKLNFRREEYTFRGGHRTLAEVQVFTKNKRLVKFLAKEGMNSATWKALRKTAQRATCATLFQGKKLARLERALKASLSRHIRRKTRRAPGAFDLMLVTEADRSGNTACIPPKTRK